MRPELPIATLNPIIIQLEHFFDHSASDCYSCIKLDLDFYPETWPILLTKADKTWSYVLFLETSEHTSKSPMTASCCVP